MAATVTTGCRWMSFLASLVGAVGLLQPCCLESLLTVLTVVFNGRLSDGSVLRRSARQRGLDHLVSMVLKPERDGKALAAVIAIIGSAY